MPGYENLRLIAITGWGQSKDKEKALQAGFNHHLVKPVSVEALADAIEAVTTVSEPL